jgi:hypothetical protein
MAGLAPLRLGLFSPSLSHLVAIREGYYEERGVTVEQQRIPSSAGLLPPPSSSRPWMSSPTTCPRFSLPGASTSIKPPARSRLVAGFRQAMNYCLDPTHHADCTNLVVSEWQVNPDVAARMVDAAADARTGLVPDAVITPAQLEVVLKLRERWGGFSEYVDIAAEIRRPRGLIDERFARVA